MDLDKAREFIREHHRAVIATRRSDGAPQMSIVAANVDNEGRVIVSTRETAVKARNLRRDPRMSLCIEDGARYVTLEGRAELIEDRTRQEHEVNALIAPRYIGQRLGSSRWTVIQGSDRVGIRMHVEKVDARGI